MWDSPTPVLISFFVFVLLITKVLSDNYTRRKILDSHASEPVVSALFRGYSNPGLFGALKWGIVLVSLGLGLGVADLLRAGFEQPLAWGVVMAFAGGGLLAYYAIASAVVRREEWSGRDAPAPRRPFPDDDI